MQARDFNLLGLDLLLGSLRVCCRQSIICITDCNRNPYSRLYRICTALDICPLFQQYQHIKILLKTVISKLGLMTMQYHTPPLPSAPLINGL